MNRRSFIRNSAIGGACLIGGVYTWQIEPYWLEIVKKSMPIANLPDGLVGKTLMQISDIHIGNRFDYSFIIESFQTAQDLHPDFVVYTGDYVSYEDGKQLRQLEEVLQYTVKGKLGTVGVLGNHDYGKAWAELEVADKITAMLGGYGVDVLRNDQRNINGLNFIGFDDYWSPNFYPEKGIEHYNSSMPSILLCHNPDVCDLDVWGGYTGWILSGHTHGEQCKPPFLNPPMLPVKNKKYSSGEIDLEDGRRLYINRALGHLWPVRFNVRPEITVFELTQV
ncbi:MAG: metallophosphoesterase [Rhodothermaceae bacterium]|nr:metallophosphoesterase [Rhodothermaceae bacterium]